MSRIRGHGNNKSTGSKLFWSIQKNTKHKKVGMINNSTPINIISHTDKVMHIEIIETF